MNTIKNYVENYEFNGCTISVSQLKVSKVLNLPTIDISEMNCYEKNSLVKTYPPFIEKNT